MTILWQPQTPESSRMAGFMRFIESNYGVRLSNYAELHQWSIQYIAKFWQALSAFFSIPFSTPPTQILTPNKNTIQGAQWFSGAKFNFASVLLSREDNHPALICINENNDRHRLSYFDLKQQTADCAAGFKALGLREGDRVAAVLPNVHYTVIAMLACASLGAIWSSCSPDFGAAALVDRFAEIKPTLLLISDGHQYQGKVYSSQDKLDVLINALPSVKTTIICPVINRELRLPTSNIMWSQCLIPNSPSVMAQLPFDHPLYILFSSGTTGTPKCIVHGAGGTLLQHLKELGLHTDLKQTDNLFFFTTCGWMMWNWMISGLALGATLTLYEGAPTFPNAERLFNLIDEEKITIFGTSAKFLSSIEKSGVRPIDHNPLNSLRTILTTGSPLLPENFDYVYRWIKKDVQLSSISGGTDIISCFALGNPLLPVYRGELQCLGLGMDVQIYTLNGEPVLNEAGELVCVKPFPSMPLYFWHDRANQRYTAAYFERFPGIWTHGDSAQRNDRGGLVIYGRTDAILNPGGVRIGTAEIYRPIQTIAEIEDSIVIAQPWQGDVRIVLFVKLREGSFFNDELDQRIRKTIRLQASPRHVPAKILQVDDIPRTRNGKIMEIAVRQTVQGETVANLSSIANPESLVYFKERPELQV